jgi:Ran GTPase-activating protein 1
LNSREDIEPYLADIRAIAGGVEEIHLGGNTLGVGACEALADALRGISTLKVRHAIHYS